MRVPHTFEQNPLDIAHLVAKDAATSCEKKRANYIPQLFPILSQDPDPAVQIGWHIRRLISEWQVRGELCPIVHEHPFSAIILLSAETSCLLGEIPVPRPADGLYWGTTFSNTTDVVAYQSMFFDAGVVSSSLWFSANYLTVEKDDGIFIFYKSGNFTFPIEDMQSLFTCKWAIYQPQSQEPGKAIWSLLHNLGKAVESWAMPAVHGLWALKMGGQKAKDVVHA